MTQITVIVPIYNVELYLPQCIDSILTQTYSDFELILVDDGSPDNCGMICDAYAQKDHRIRVIHKENGGVSMARNAALKIATGKYVTFCDSDDFYRQDWIESLLLSIQTHHADMVVGNFLHLSEKTLDLLGQSKHKTGVYPIGSTKERIDYILQHFFSGSHGCEACTRLFRLDIINKYNIEFNENCGNFAEDLGFVLEYLLYATKVVSIDSPGYCYRIRSGSMMQVSKNIVRLDSVNEVAIRFLSVAKNAFPKENQSVLPIFYFLIMYNQYMKMIGTERYPYLKDELKKIRNYKQWKSNTKAIFHCKRQLRLLLGKTNASRILILCRYCMHGNWKLFSLESALFYKFHRV